MYNQPENSEESKAGPHHLKLDLVADSIFACRTVHNNMLMCSSMALDNLSRTIPPIDSDQKVALLHAPFKGTTHFGGKLAKLHRANKECASSVTVYPAYPLRLTPLSLTQAVAGLLRKVAPPTGEVAGMEIRADPPLRPQLLNRPSLGMVKPP